MSEDDQTGSGGASGPPPDDKAAAPSLRSKLVNAARRKARKQDPLELRALLAEPLHILRDGKPGKMDPIEASLRKQVQKALVDKNMASIKAVIDLAIEHKLIASPAPPAKGGVLEVPVSIGREPFEKIFKTGEISTVDEILAILEQHYGKG